MVRNVRKMSAQVKQERAKRTGIANRELGTQYWLCFLPLTGFAIQGSLPGSQEEVDDWHARFNILLPGNPEKNPEFVDSAIKTFEANHGVKSWLEVAASHEIKKRYFA